MIIPHSNENPLCICGHVYDEHGPKSCSCVIDGCLCACFEQDDAEEAQEKP